MTVSLGASSPFGSYVSGRSHASVSRKNRSFSRLLASLRWPLKMDSSRHGITIEIGELTCRLDDSKQVDTWAN